MALFLILLSGLWFSCASKKINPFNSDELMTLKKSFDLHKEARIKSMKSAFGWATVVGFHWLNFGVNSIGSDAENDIVVEKSFTSKIGQIEVKNEGLLIFKSEENVLISENGKPVNEKNMDSDAAGQPTILWHNSLNMFVLKRGERFALRLRDTLAKSRLDFESIPTFQFDQDFIFEAEVLKTASDNFIKVMNVVGVESEFKIEAKLKFNYKRRTYQLLAFDGGRQSYFIVFNDLTSGIETYGGGRFLYVKREEENSNSVILNFNESINPPCAFTDFATCPIPPLDNFLNINVKAGEKSAKSH